MNQEASATNLLADLNRPRNHILKEGGPKSSSLVRRRDPESSEQRNGLGVPAGALPQPCRHLGWDDRGHRPRVVGHHLIVIRFGDDEYPCRIGGVGLTGVPPQPLRLLDGTTFERFDHIVWTKRSRRQVPTVHSSTKGDGRSISDRKPPRSRAGRRLAASHERNAAPSSSKTVRSASTRCAATLRLDTTKSVRSVSDAATARLMSSRSSTVVRTSSRSLRLRFVSMGVLVSSTRTAIVRQCAPSSIA
jgi:hypothetical protein